MFSAGAQVHAQNQTAKLINVTDMFNWSSPSTDPTGVVFVPDDNALLVGDSEINETVVFSGSNVFQTRLDGALLDTFSTLAFTDEPAGLTINPSNGHLFISTDNSPRGVYEIDPGADGRYINADDTISFFSSTAFNSLDPEGITYNPLDGRLYIVDGEANLVYVVDPGLNAQFDGVAPVGDDTVVSFSTGNLGIVDPEGVAYDIASNGLYIIGEPRQQLLHVTSSGEFIRMITLDSALLRKPSGLAIAPSSLANGAQSLYVVDRGVDNDVDPNENDGRMFEFSLPPMTGNQAPVVSITTPVGGQGAALGAAINFTGVAIDAEEGDLSAGLIWQSDLDGQIGNGAAFTSSALSTGLHTITASTVDATLAQGFMSVRLRIFPAGRVILERRISNSADDAEERGNNGNVWLSSDDLELLRDNTVPQTVGLRFNGLQIPTGAIIEEAFIQFKAEETQSAPVNLLIRAQASDNAAQFARRKFNLTNRSVTDASSLWQPVVWPTNGESGVAQKSSDLTALVQEVVNRPGWSAGNAMAFFISGTDAERRTAESFDGDPGGAPLLFIQYQELAAAPELAISSPNNGDSFDAGSPVTFAASASDARDGDLSDSVVWESSLNGALGTGSSVTISNLTAGVHLVTASVVNSSGRSVSTGVSIVIEAPANSAPAVSTTSPDDNLQIIFGTPVTLSATAVDNEDGDLSDVIFWESNLDGNLGSGAQVIANSLSSGTHQITARVSDSGGLSSFATVAVTVAMLSNTVPEVTISAPANGLSVVVGTPVSLSATATDAEDGDLSTEVSWVSDLDGVLFSGAATNLDSLSVGRHRITASVLDSEGLSGSAIVTITIEPLPNAAPVLTITSPLDGFQVTVGSPVALIASASDAEDGDLSDAIAWTSDLDGDLGTGSQLSADALSTGTHLITASVSDSEAVSTSSTISVIVESATNTSPVVIISSPEGGRQIGVGAQITLVASASDQEDGDLSASIVWSSDLDGSLGTGSPSVTLSEGEHTLTAAVTDSGELTVTDSVQVEALAVLDVVVSSRVNASSDDAEERGTRGRMALTSRDIELTQDLTVEQSVGLRFNDLQIPRGAGIISAYIQFQVDEISSELTFLEIAVQESNNPATFTSNRFDLSLRPRSALTIDWLPSRWLAAGDAGAAQQTTDLQALVQRIVNREDWSPGNSMVFIVDGDGTRTAEAFDGDADGAPQLTITYTLENSAPVVSTSNDLTVTLGELAFISGTVNDDGIPSNNGIPDTEWTVAEGPSGASFDDASSLSTTVNFDSIGVYTLVLRASDGQLSAYDELNVNVQPSPENLPPTVSAGPDRLVTLGETVFLAGEVDDDGLPADNILENISWVQVEGPSDAIIGSAGNAGTVVQFPQTGEYLFELSAFDGEFRSTDEVSVTVADLSGNGVINVPVIDADDDAEESAQGEVDLSSSDLELTEEKSNQVVGIRFRSLLIPNASTITNAYIQFTVDERDAAQANLVLQAESVDSSAAYTTADQSLSSRSLTQSSVSWSPVAWTTVGQSTATQATPDLSALIQEIVDRPGWVAGNALSIMVSGSGTRTAESYDGDAESAARLVIEFQINE